MQIEKSDVVARGTDIDVHAGVAVGQGDVAGYALRVTIGFYIGQISVQAHRAVHALV